MGHRIRPRTENHTQVGLGIFLAHGGDKGRHRGAVLLVRAEKHLTGRVKLREERLEAGREVAEIASVERRERLEDRQGPGWRG